MVGQVDWTFLREIHIFTPMIGLVCYEWKSWSVVKPKLKKQFHEYEPFYAGLYIF